MFVKFVLPNKSQIIYIYKQQKKIFLIIYDKWFNYMIIYTP